VIRSSAPVVAQDRVNLPLRFFAGVLLTLAVALALFALLMRPPFADLRAMTLFLSITAVISLAAGTAAYRLGWLERSPSVAWTLVAIYGLASLLTFINVWVTARLMFASQHDLLLATVLLLFAGGIAMALSSFLSADLARRMRILSDAAGAVAAGQLATHVEVTGHDELAALGRSFNAMSEQLEQSARRQQALEIQRRDLIAWAGHDLRTPLASVRAIIEALADGMVDDHASMERYLSTAQREVQSLSTLIDDLFELAQLDAGGLQLVRRPVALGDLVSDTLESFAALARERGVVLAGHPPDDNDIAEVDGEKIGRVLSNLVGNAIRYSPPGTRVEVSLRPGAQEVILRVCDSGPGIEPGDLGRIFERFYRGEKSRSRATGGAGLGLAIAKGLVEAHGGRIWVESVVGQGACFSMALPRNAPVV
jgi:signal transduction histidine kinase